MNWTCFTCGQSGATGSCVYCGSDALGRVNGNDVLVEATAASGLPCTRCGAQGEPVRFTRFRRVTGMLIFDRIQDEAGYYCSRCRWHRFAANTAHTLCLGWLGVFALLIRSPYAILVNVKALWRAPLAPETFGALRWSELVSALAEGNEEPESLRPGDPLPGPRLVDI